MNVYDFDKTLYHRDSSVDFYRFILKKYPLILRYLPKQLCGVFGHFVFHSLDVTSMKDRLYCYFQGIEDIDKEIEEFWHINKKDIHEWYYAIAKEDDVVISASPVFLVKPMCDMLGIKNVFGSLVDKKTGKTLAVNCHREQKCRVLREAGYDLNEIDEFYSDSYNDTPLAECSKKAYRIKNGEITEWEFKQTGK